MTKRSLLLAAAVAALMSFGSSAQAAFSVLATFSNGTTTFVPTAPGFPGNGLTFTANRLDVLGNGPVSYSLASITYSSATRSVAPVTFTVAGTLAVTNNGTTANAAFSYNFTYSVNSIGEGTLTLNGTPFITPLTVNGVTFTPPTFSSPTLTPTNPADGALSTTAAAVPEPASVAMVGLGLAGLGGLALRRRSAK